MEYPLGDKGSLRRLKSILSATRSKFNDLEPKREIRTFPLMKSPRNLGRYTQSITKFLHWTPSLKEEYQKKDDFHKGTIKVPLAPTITQSGEHSQLLVKLQSWQNASQAESEALEKLILTGETLAPIFTLLGCGHCVSKNLFQKWHGNTLQSQETALLITEKRNLVIKRATGPKQLER